MTAISIITASPSNPDTEVELTVSAPSLDEAMSVANRMSNAIAEPLSPMEKLIKANSQSAYGQR